MIAYAVRIMGKTDGIVLVVDDGGFPCENGDALEPYKRIGELAERFNVIVPVAVTACYIDLNNIAGLERINRDAEKIVDFLRTNTNRLPVWNHGLTHAYGEASTEFALYGVPSGSVPESVQQSHFELSQRIFRDAHLPLPRVFVPPGHAWEPTVTDRLAAAAGFSHIAIREFEKKSLGGWLLSPRNPYLATWDEPQGVKPLYRLGLGIPHYQHRLGRGDRRKVRIYTRPGNVLTRLLVYRTTGLVRKPHHFFAHVQNFVNPGSEKFWADVITILLNFRAFDDDTTV